MHYRRNLKVAPEALRQRVRRYPRDLLLREIARSSAQAALDRESSSELVDEKLSVIREGYLTQLGAICITNCNNHRSAHVDSDVVGDLVNGFFNVWDPDLDSPSELTAMKKVLSRAAYVQMPYQQSPWESLMRTRCLFGDDPRFGSIPLHANEWREILGATIDEFLRVGFGMYVAAIHNAGAISRQTLLAEHVAPAFDPVPQEQALRVVDRWLANSVDEIVELARQNTPDPDDLWKYTPLYEWPIVVIDDDYIVPSPLGLLQRLSPQGLYFVARDALAADSEPDRFQAFTSTLGGRFEDYIGEQLRNIENVRLHSEILYESGTLSVDYIIETDDVLVLVEAKSVAPDVDTRSGNFPEQGSVHRDLTRACNQIDHTVAKIEEGHPSFPQLMDRPIRGLIVTREQYYNLPLPFIIDEVQPASVPTTIVSSQQLEYAISALRSVSKCGALLLESLASDTTAIKTDLHPLPIGTNPLLKELWSDWSSKQRPTESNSSAVNTND